MNDGLIRGLPREFPSFRGLRVNGPLQSVYLGDNQSGTFSGLNNVVIGDSAGQQMRGAGQCVVVGAQAGQSLSDAATDASVFIGYQAAQNALRTAGLNDVCIGYQAGQADTGGFNVFIGYTAGALNTSGSASVALGYDAGNGYCSNSVYIGYQAGRTPSSSPSAIVCIGYKTGLNISGSGTVLVGYQAGASNTSGVNTMVGYQSGVTGTSGNATTTGTRQTLFGYNTGANTSTQLNDIVCIGDTAQTGGASSVVIGSSAVGTGSDVIIGYEAGTTLSASNCVIIGYQAGNSGDTNNDSVLIGYGAGQSSTQYCVCIGVQTGHGGTGQSITGSTMIGMSAGHSATTGSQLMVGYQAGYATTTGVNTFLGYQSGYSPAANGTTYATTTGTGQTCVGQNTGQAVLSATAPNYITCLGYKTTAGASGAVAIGTDHTGAGATTSTQDQIALGTANHTLLVAGSASIAGSGKTLGFYGATAVARASRVGPVTYGGTGTSTGAALPSIVAASVDTSAASLVSVQNLAASLQAVLAALDLVLSAAGSGVGLTA